ncbi:MAG: tetratricopeptide repeat protein [Amphritea sp.]
MAFRRSIWQLTNRITRQLPLALAIAVACNGSVQAEDTASSYCLNAGADNYFNCSKAATVNTNQADIDSKLSELTRWLEDEERAINGESSLTQGQPHTRNADLQQKIDFNAQLLADQLKKAHALQSQGNYGAAFTEVDNYLVSHPKDPNGWLLYGIALMDQNKLSATEDAFSKLVKLYPNAPEPYNNLAAIYARQGENNKAVNTLLQAFNTHPSYALVQQNLKTVYASLATQAYNRALDLDESVNTPRPDLAILNQVYQQQSIPLSSTAVAQKQTPSKPDTKEVSEAQPKQVLASQMAISTELVIEERKVSEGTVPAHQEELAESASPAIFKTIAADNAADNQAKATQPVAKIAELNDATAQEISTLINQWAAA